MRVHYHVRLVISSARNSAWMLPRESPARRSRSAWCAPVRLDHPSHEEDENELRGASGGGNRNRTASRRAGRDGRVQRRRGRGRPSTSGRGFGPARRGLGGREPGSARKTDARLASVRLALHDPQVVTRDVNLDSASPRVKNLHQHLGSGHGPLAAIAGLPGALSDGGQFKVHAAQLRAQFSFAESSEKNRLAPRKCERLRASR